MKLYDISVPLARQTPVYPGDSPVQLRPLARIRDGVPMNTGVLRLGTHAGTHVDAPYHFLEGGARVDQLPLDLFFGSAWVCDLPHAKRVGAGELEAAGVPGQVQRLLLRTSNGALWDSGAFQEGYVSLDASAARWIVDRGVRLVGVDYLSVEGVGTADFPVHHILLEAGVVILEGLDLRGVASGSYTLACFPLRLTGGDAAPVRAVLLQTE